MVDARIGKEKQIEKKMLDITSVPFFLLKMRKLKGKR